MDNQSDNPTREQLIIENAALHARFNEVEKLIEPHLNRYGMSDVGDLARNIRAIVKQIPLDRRADGPVPRAR